MNTTTTAAVVAANGAKPVTDLLYWCDSVVAVGWRTRDAANQTVVEFFEQEGEYDETETVDVATFGGCGHKANARLCAAAPELYEAARQAMGLLRRVTLYGATEIRMELAAALAKAGGGELGVTE